MPEFGGFIGLQIRRGGPDAGDGSQRDGLMRREGGLPGRLGGVPDPLDACRVSAGQGLGRGGRDHGGSGGRMDTARSGIGDVQAQRGPACVEADEKSENQELPQMVAPSHYFQCSRNPHLPGLTQAGGMHMLEPMSLNRRSFLGALPMPLLAQAPPRRPNIVFILADDLGFGDLGCYGQTRIQTPNLDRLAAGGMRFTQAYAGATVCAPSRCCLMTGKHTGHATVRGNKKPEVGLRADEPTAASMLKRAGYRTALFGKWGLGGPGTGSVPNTRGFDEFYGYLDQQHAHNSYPEHLWDNQNEVMLRENWFWQRKLFSNDLFTQKALGWLEKQERANPFYLYLAYTIPHANNELGAFQANGMENPDFGPYADREWPEVEKTFAASITRMDRDIGRVLAALESRGLLEDTLILFSSDNGPHREGNHSPTFFESSGTVRGIKRDLNEGGIRVPTIASWKGRIRAGQVVDAPWAFWDFLPTACELARVPAPGGIDGKSIVPTLLEGRTVARDYFYWEFHEGGFAQAVRSGNWKLIRQKPKFEPELYDLAADPIERNNLAASRPEVLSRLLPLLRQARTESEHFPATNG